MAGRRWRAALAGLVVLGAVGGLGWATPAGAGTASTDVAPTLSVTPTTDLLDQNPVRVTGTGYTPGQGYVLLDCTAEDCVDPDGYFMTVGALHAPLTTWFDSRRAVTAAPDGTISTSLRLSREIYLGEMPEPVEEGSFVDCSEVACSLVAVPAVDVADRLVEVPVSFQATGTYVWTAGTIDVDVPARLPDQGTVHVSGTGWDPGFYEDTWWGDKLFGVDVELCATGAGSGPIGCLSQAPTYPAVDHDGAVDADVTLDRFLLPEGGGSWDCRAKTCALRLAQGSRASAEVPITFGPEWSPFTSASEMVDRLGRRITGGPLPSSVRNLLVGGLANGSLAATHVVRELIQRADAPRQVGSLYASVLDRRPDTAGLQFWVARRRTGTTAARIAEQFANTPEVRAWHQSLDATQAVVQTYERVLGRSADQEGVDYWVGRLDGGLPRAKMIASFALSAESRAHTAGRGWWTALTLGTYGRAPTAEEWGIAGGVDLLGAQEQAIRTALGSDEVRDLAEAPIAVP